MGRWLAVGWKRAMGREVLEMGQLALSNGPARMGIRYHGQRADIPSKGILL